jgi:hypothetical protein
MRYVFGVATILLSWLLMQAVHEAGHVVAGWCIGDRVVQVVLHPLAISRTDLEPGHHPVWTTAAGPVFGSLAPLLVWIITARSGARCAFWLRFFAGFCLIANGAYVGVAVIAPVGDAEVLLQHGVPGWLLGLYGLATVPAGLALWNGLGPEFGWGPRGKSISWRATLVLIAVLMAIVVLEVALN